VIRSLSYAEALRAIGRLLDEESAARASVAEDPVSLTVTWLGREKQRHQRQFRKGDDIPSLIDQPRKQRFHRRDWENSWEERLRTIGQELDAEGIQLLELVEAVGFKVTGTAGGATVRRWYTWDDLAHRSEERRRSRRRSQPGAAGSANGAVDAPYRRGQWPRPSEGTGFSASVDLDPRSLTDDAAALAKSVVQPLLRLAGPSVNITLEIRAELPPDVPSDALQTIEESCQRLGFTLQHDAQPAREG
jgi:hypothetical protein